MEFLENIFALHPRASWREDEILFCRSGSEVLEDEEFGEATRTFYLEFF